MTTNFFNQIASLNIKGVLQLNISKGSENNMIVSVMLNNNECGDNAKQLIVPLNVRGTISELDEGFFEQITKPVQAVSGLMINMEAFMKQLEEVKKQSAMEKEKSGAAKKEQEEKEKKYKEVMQKVDELERAGKYKDAWLKMPDPALFGQWADIIRKRKSALAAKFSPDLFGQTPTPNDRGREEQNTDTTINNEEEEEEEEKDYSAYEEIADNYEDDTDN
jgi:PRTRC genetic system protein E